MRNTLEAQINVVIEEWLGHWESIYKDSYKKYKAWVKEQVAVGFRKNGSGTSEYRFMEANPRIGRMWLEYGRSSKLRRTQLKQLKDTMSERVTKYLDKFLESDMTLVGFKYRNTGYICEFFALLDTPNGQRVLTMKVVYAYAPTSHIRYCGWLKKDISEYHELQ